MKALFACLLALFSALLPKLGAAEEITFDQCVGAVGPEYVRLRNALLDQGGARADLGEKARSSDWAERATAVAILGWLEHGKKYKELVDGEKVRNLVGEERYVWSSNPEQIDKSLLPLAYEFLFKNSAGPAGQTAAERMIPFLLKDEMSQDFRTMLGAFYDADVRPSVRESIARVVAALPGNAIHAEELTEMLFAEASRRQPSEESTGRLMNGLIARASALRDDAKGEIVEDLLRSEALGRAVDRKKIVYTVGGVGGEHAVPVVAEYLKSTTLESEQRWAISALGAIGTPEASHPILEVLHARSTSEGVRLVAVEALATCELTGGVKSSLGEILHDERQSSSLRRAAYESLQKLLNANGNNEDRVREIRALLKGVNPDAIRKLPGARRDE